MTIFPRIALAMTSSIFLMCAASASSASAADFYQGKTLTLTLGFPPGGGYDASIRLLARYIGRHVPGHPSVVVLNRPGAGSLTSANYMYNSAPADGTVVGMFSSTAIMESVFGNAAAQFDPLKFNWIGGMSQDVTYCGIWQKPGAPSTFDEVLKRETLIGAGATSAITYQQPMILKNIIGAKMKIVSGYQGTGDINLAMVRGEVNGSCGLFTSSILSQWKKEVTSGHLKLVIQMGSNVSKQFGDIPSVYQYAKTDEQREILNLAFGQLLLARPLVAPPGTPGSRVEILRKAFFETLADKQFLENANRIGIVIDPVSPTQISALLKKYEQLPKEIIQKTVAAMSGS